MNWAFVRGREVSKWPKPVLQDGRACPSRRLDSAYEFTVRPTRSLFPGDAQGDEDSLMRMTLSDADVDRLRLCREGARPQLACELAAYLALEELQLVQQLDRSHFVLTHLGRSRLNQMLNQACSSSFEPCAAEVRRMLGGHVP